MAGRGFGRARPFHVKEIQMSKMRVSLLRLAASAALAASVLASAACGGGDDKPGAEVLTAGGDITAAVEQYRQLLGGPNHGGEPGTKSATGFREINWDGVPNEQSAPNLYAGDFFNGPQAPRARGLVLSTPGTGLMVSAAANNPDRALPRFGNLNPGYVDQFKAFSAEKLFSPVGSNIADVTFFVPGTNTPALVRGFGAVYTDIDTEHTAFEYFDADGKSLGKYAAPVAAGGLSFLGVVFDEPIIAKVRVAYGTAALGPDDGPSYDVAVMDNFIYGEPQPIKD